MWALRACICLQAMQHDSTAATAILHACVQPEVVLQEVHVFKTRADSQQSKVLSVLSGTCAQSLLSVFPQLAFWH